MNAFVELQPIVPQVLDECMRLPGLFDLLHAHPGESLFDILEPLVDDDWEPAPGQTIGGLPLTDLIELDERLDVPVELEPAVSLDRDLAALVFLLRLVMPEEHRFLDLLDLDKATVRTGRVLLPSAESPPPELLPAHLVRRGAGLFHYVDADSIASVWDPDALERSGIQPGGFRESGALQRLQKRLEDLSGALDDAMTYDHRVLLVATAST